MKRTIIVMGVLSLLFGCKKEIPSESQPVAAIAITNDDQHNEVYKRGSQLISPHMQLLDRNPKITKTVREEVTQGIRDMDAVTAYNPQNWAAFWIKGKAHQVLGEHKAANSAFKASFDIQRENPDVAREYAASCLELGYGAEAVRATEHAIQLAPSDAGLHANLALALLIDGRNTEAKQAIDGALKMAPDDKISRELQRAIDDVLSGKRTQPKTMSDLNNR